MPSGNRDTYRLITMHGALNDERLLKKEPF